MSFRLRCDAIEGESTIDVFDAFESTCSVCFISVSGVEFLQNLKMETDFEMFGDHLRGPGESSFVSDGPRKDLL